MKTTLLNKVQVEITGYTWGGFLSEYTYELNFNEIDNFKKLNDFKKIAGDFQTITGAVILKSFIKNTCESILITK